MEDEKAKLSIAERNDELEKIVTEFARINGIGMTTLLGHIEVVKLVLHSKQFLKGFE